MSGLSSRDMGEEGGYIETRIDAITGAASPDVFWYFLGFKPSKSYKFIPILPTEFQNAIREMALNCLFYCTTSYVSLWG